MIDTATRYIAPFNGPVEIGLRALAVLNEAYPNEYSLQRLVIYDYLIVHSDDVVGGPEGLHPKTPHRSGELLVRRKSLQQGLFLFMSRRLIEQSFRPAGVGYSATERTSGFIDVLGSEYVADLQQRAAWVVERFREMPDDELQQFVRNHLGDWGAEFAMESVLWMEDPE